MVYKTHLFPRSASLYLDILKCRQDGFVVFLLCFVFCGVGGVEFEIGFLGFSP